jgi:hypothetical protein
MIEDTHRVPCESCGAKILAVTAEFYGGYCAPCHKRFNETPAIYRQPPPPESFFSKIVGFLIPIGILALFVIGIPLGYKLVLGGRKSTVEEGRIQQITLINSIPILDLSGQHARIVTDYIVVELKSGRKLWIPEENVAGIEFQSKK